MSRATVTLWEAAAQGDVVGVNHALRGCDVNSVGPAGRTALVEAAMANQTSVFVV